MSTSDAISVLVPRRKSDAAFQVLFDQLTAALSWILLAGGVAAAVNATYLVVASYMRVPFWDGWAVIYFLAHPDRSVLSWLWAQHNEHRILVPKLILLFDYRWFHALGIFPLALILTLQSILVVMLTGVLQTWAGWPGSLWRTGAGLTALCAFSTAQWENFVSGFQICFVFVGVFLVLSVVLLLFSRRSHDHAFGEHTYAILAALTATAGTYSVANGVVIWPVLIFLAIAQRSRRSVVALLAASGILAIWSYLYHYESPSYHPGPLSSLRHPYQILVYMAGYLGAPLDWGYNSWAFWIGAAAIAGAAVVLWLILSRSKREPVTLLCASLLLFAMGSAGMTALGRLSFGSNEALSSRYSSIALLLWAGFGILLLRLAAKRSTTAVLTMQVVVLLIMAFAATEAKKPLEFATARSWYANTTSLAMVTGVYDRPQIGTVFPDIIGIWKIIPFMRQHDLSIFATRFASELHKPLQSSYRIRPQPCWGDVNQVTLPTGEEHGLRIFGWAWDPVRRRSVREIIFVSAGSIVGYAQPGYPRADIYYRLASRTAKKAGWLGYVEPMRQPSAVSIYAAIGWRGNVVCPLAHMSRGLGVAAPPIQISAGEALSRPTAP